MGKYEDFPCSSVIGVEIINAQPISQFDVITDSGGGKSPRGPMKINDATLLERNKSVTDHGGHTLYDRPRLKEPLFAWKTSVCSHSAWFIKVELTLAC